MERPPQGKGWDVAVDHLQNAISAVRPGGAMGDEAVPEDPDATKIYEALQAVKAVRERDQQRKQLERDRSASRKRKTDESP